MQDPIRSSDARKHLSLASFTVPEFMCDSTWADHAPFAFWLIDALRPRTVVELGTFAGYSYFAFCQAVKAAALETRCYAIDTWQGDEHGGFYGQEIYGRLSAHNDRNYSAFSQLVRSTFDDARRHFSDGTIDLLHIDGRHFYDDVKHDFETWVPKLSDRAVVLFHDTNVRERDFGVFKLWEELRERFPAFEFVHGYGLGVIAVGKEVPPSVAEFLAAAKDPKATADLRLMYARLGTVFKRENIFTAEKNDLTARLQSATADATTLFAQREALSGELRAASERAADLAQEVRELADLNEAQRALESELNSKIEGLSREAARLRAEELRQGDIIRAMTSSTSWRVTAPVRAAGRIRVRTRVIVMPHLLKIYHLAPLPLPVKRFARDVFLTVAGPLFRRSTVYQKWRQDRRERAAQAIAARDAVTAPAEIDVSAAVPFGFVSSPPSTPRLAVFCHVADDSAVPEIARCLRHLPQPFDLFVSLAGADQAETVARVFAHAAPQPVIRVNPAGGHILPLLRTFKDVYFACDIVLHLQAQTAPPGSTLEHWRSFLRENLLGSPAVVGSVLSAFARHAQLGMVASQHYEPARGEIAWGNGFDSAAAVARQLGIPLARHRILDFPGDATFWARPAALKPLLDLDAANTQPAAATAMASAVDRLAFHVVERAGFRWIKVADPTLFHDTTAIVAIDTADALDTFIATRALKLGAPDLPRPAVPARPLLDPPRGLIARLQSRALGSDREVDPATKVAIGVVTYNNDARQLRRLFRGARVAIARAGLARRILAIENGDPSPYFAAPDVQSDDIVRLPSAGNLGFGGAQNRLMAKAFADGADIYIAANPDGAFHPDAILALAQMIAAHDGRALVEALQFPSEHPKAYDPITFETAWASGACLAIPRHVYETLGGFDDAFFMYCEDVDLSWRARANGISVYTCPRALFLHAAGERSQRAAQMMRESGVILARKWGNAAFETWLVPQLRELGGTLPEKRPEPVPAAWQPVAEFRHQFSFAPVRW